MTRPKLTRIEREAAELLSAAASNGDTVLHMAEAFDLLWKASHRLAVVTVRPLREDGWSIPLSPEKYAEAECRLRCGELRRRK
jgi:hypothetical protein